MNKLKIEQLRIKILSSDSYNYEKLNSKEIWNKVLEDLDILLGDDG